MTTNEIIKGSEAIDKTKISNEILDWLINNVEYFIDNHNKLFKIDLIIDETSKAAMGETYKLQELFKSIPDDSLPNEQTAEEQAASCEHCRQHLNEIVESIYQEMKLDTERLSKLFKKMSFFYELKGINKGRLLIQQLEGSVDIIKFEYEGFSVPVKVFQKSISENELAEIDIEQEEKKLVKEYVVPEGFTVWIEISFKPVEQTTSMF